MEGKDYFSPADKYDTVLYKVRSHSSPTVWGYSGLGFMFMVPTVLVGIMIRA